MLKSTKIDIKDFKREIKKENTEKHEKCQNIVKTKSTKLKLV